MASAPNGGGMTPKSTPKTMSSRLMTMKFMQRGAAASAASSPVTPRTAESEGGSAKRRKVSHGTPTAETGKNRGESTPLYDQKAIREALEEEERKRQVAIAKRAAELGDSHWVLAGNLPKPQDAPRPSLKIVQVGFAQIDSPGIADDSDSPVEAKGTFFRFNQVRALCVVQYISTCMLVNFPRGVLAWDRVHVPSRHLEFQSVNFGFYRNEGLTEANRRNLSRRAAQMAMAPNLARFPHRMRTLRQMRSKMLAVGKVHKTAHETDQDPVSQVGSARSGPRRNSWQSNAGRKRSSLPN
jgi:hypothetical protein